jgi:two-component system, OmpR family, phosphate regulon sensor histidine kinase PhoR
MKSRRLLWQIYPANLLITLGAIIVITWFGSTTVRNFFFAQMRSDLEARGQLIAQQITKLTLSSPDELQNFCRQVGRQATMRITVVAPDGTVLADSNENPANMDNHANRPELMTAFMGKTGSSIRFSRTLGQNMLYIAIPLAESNGRLIGTLRLAVSISAMERTLKSMYLKVFAGCIFVIVFAALVTLLVSRKISRPLEVMTQGAEKLARGDTASLIAVDTASMSTEVAALARSMNRMANQIKDRINTITLQRNELETFFASMAEMVLAINTEKKIIRINRSAATLFYLSPDDVQGKILHGVIRNKDLHQIVDEVLDTAESVEKDIYIFIGGDKLFLHTKAVPILNDRGKLTGVLVVMNDMTRLQKLENLRRDFVANVSHELKTPVTSIQGYVETLLDGALENPDDARRFLEIVARQTARLDNIIDDLLTLSQIELKIDQHEISLVRANLHEVLETAVQTCLSKALDKNIRIDILCDKNLQVKINPNLLEQAVINLLNNAITYSPNDRKITTRAVLEKQAEKKDRLIISVEDQGIGIEQEHLERLFERFYRCDKSRSSTQGGTGLGLSIVKHIAIAHSGSVTVRSEPGKGSTFSIIIPQ